MSSWKKIQRKIEKNVKSMVHKPLSYAINTVGNTLGIDDLSEKITKGTIDKWIAPEHKDTVEGVVIALASAGAIPGVPSLTQTLSNITGITNPTQLRAMAGAVMNPKDPLRGAVVGAYMPKVAGQIQRTFGTDANVSRIIADGAYSAAIGQDPKAGMLNSAARIATEKVWDEKKGNPITDFLNNIPGDVGDFFRSDIGKTVSGFFTGVGGNIGQLGSLLDNIGLTGAKKDMVEEMLTIAALTQLGQMTAKDAIEIAKGYEEQQKQLTQSLVEDAKKMSDPKYIETNVQKAQAEVNKQYGSARIMEQQNLFARGLGNRMPGRVGAISADQAVANAKARQDIETAAPLQSMQAINMALTPVQNAAQYSRTRADEQAALPVNTYLAIKAANAKSPADDYYRAELERLKNLENTGKSTQISIPGVTLGPPNKPEEPIPGAVSAENPLYHQNTFTTGWANMYPPANNYNSSPPAPSGPVGDFNYKNNGSYYV